MEDIRFWKDWPFSSKVVLFVGMGVFVALSVLSLLTMSDGADPISQWKTLDIVQELLTTPDVFTYQLNEYELQTKGYLYDQYFTVLPAIQYGDLPVYYIVLLGVAGVLALTGISMIKKSLWMSLALACFLSWFYFMNIAELYVFGVEGNMVMFGTMILVIAVTYVVNAFFQNLPALMRFLLFSLVLGGILWVLMSQAQINQAAMHLSTYGMWAPICIALLFILMVSYDFLSTFLRVITASRNARPGMNLLNFLVISGIYFGNLILFFMKSRGMIDWQLLYFNPLVLLVLSSILGMWGHKRRLTNFPKMLDFHGGGIFIYLGMGIATLATFYFAYGTGNSPLSYVLEAAVLYIHLGSAGLFLLYVFINFLTPLRKGAPVYKILYEPQYLPYYVLRIGVGVFILYLAAQENYQHYNKLRSAYHGNLGDIHTGNEDDERAKNSYETCYLTYLGNQKGTIPWISQAFLEQRYQDAVEYAEQLVRYDPSPQAYVLLAHAQKLAGETFFDQITLNEGTRRFPTASQLHHNLGYVYEEANFLDSAYLSYGRARSLNEAPAETDANLLAIKIRYRLDEGIDSVLSLDIYPNDPKYQANRHFANIVFRAQRKMDLLPNLPTDSSLSLDEIQYLNNFVTSQLGQTPEKVVTLLDAALQDSEHPLGEDLSYIRLLASAWLYQPEKALSSGNTLLLYSDANLFPYYADLVGKVMLKLNSPYAAGNFFEKSWNQQFRSPVNRAGYDLVQLASSQGLTGWSLGILEQLSRVDSANVDEIQELQYLISEDRVSEILDLKREDLAYKYALLNPEVRTPKNALALVKGMKDPNWKGLTAATLMDHFVLWGDTATGRQLWDEAKLLSVATPVYQELQFQYLQLLLQQRNTIPIEVMADTLSVAAIGKQNIGTLPLFRAVAETNRKDLEAAEKNIQKALKMAPFSAIVRMEASRFYRLERQDPTKAYDVLQEGSLISPRDPVLLGAYIVECGRLGYDEFAQSAFERLEQIVPRSRYESVKALYEREQAIYQEKLEEAF